jgi:hypothetical protein
VAGDGGLAGSAGDPVHKPLALDRFHLWVPGRAHQHHAVLVEQAPVTLDEHHQVTAVPEVEPGAAVGERIGAAAGGDVERRAHATATFPVTAALVGIGGGHLPEAQLGRMRATFVAARDEGRVGRGHLLQGGHHILAGGAGRVSPGADEHEVVVHDLLAPGRETVGDEFLFGHLVVHEQHVGIAAARHVDGLAGAQGHHLHVDARGLLEQRQDVAEQARLLGGRGGRDDDALRERGTADEQTGRQGDEGANGFHQLSP